MNLSDRHAILKRLLMLLCVIAVPFVSAASSTPVAMDKHLKSVNRAIVYSEKLIDFGEFSQADQFLAQAVRLFPNNDLIAALYGKSLYESGNKDQAEIHFMKALKLNADNGIAQQYIKQIRSVRVLSESENTQQWIAIAKDKVGNLIVFVLSVWLGTSLNSIGTALSSRWHWRKAKQAYRNGDQIAVVRILEAHAQTVNGAAIRQILSFVVSQEESEDRVRAILKGLVISESNLKILLRSLDLLKQRRILL